MAGSFSTMLIGRESLVAHGAAMATVADNLANSNTTGFKEQRPEFSPILEQNLGSLFTLRDTQTGGGSKVDQITVRHDIQGVLDQTGRPLDFAVDGQGMFVVNNGTTNSYTRTGTFTADKDGFLTTGDGLFVMGYTPDQPTTLQKLQVTNATAVSKPTLTMTLRGNLNASSPVATPPANPATFEELSAGVSFTQPIEVIDSLGNTQPVLLAFSKNANLQWTATAYVDGSQTGGTAGTPVAVGTTTIAFDGSGAQAAPGATMTITAPWGNGSAPSAVALNLASMSQFAGNSSIQAINRDGVPGGTIRGITLSDTGKIMASFSAGPQVEIGTVALATFVNTDGLDRIGSTLYGETTASGAANIGNPNTSNRGKTRGGTLETSSVDVARQFVDVIRYQRGYEAGSRVVTTANEAIQTALQLAA